MDRNDKGNSMLREKVELGRILLVVVDDDESLLQLVPMLRSKYNVICMEVKTAISLLEMNKSGFYIILTDGNLPNHMDPFQLLQNFLQRNDGMNFPVIKILSNGFVRCDYHPLASTVVMPVLELVRKHFCTGLNKSDEVQQQREEEHHDEGTKILKRKKGGEHDHQGKISWRGELQEAFLKSVNEISLHGKVTGKQVRDSLRGKGFKEVELKHVNSHLQKHLNKLKKYGGSSSGQVSSVSIYHPPSELSRLESFLPDTNGNPCLLFNGDCSDIIPSKSDNFENGSVKDISQDCNNIDDASWMDFLIPDEARQMSFQHNLQVPVEDRPLTIEGSTLVGYQSSSWMTNGGQSSDLSVNDIPGQALVGNVSACHPSSDYCRNDTPPYTFFGDLSCHLPSLGESSSVEDIAQQLSNFLTTLNEDDASEMAN